MAEEKGLKFKDTQKVKATRMVLKIGENANIPEELVKVIREIALIDPSISEEDKKLCHELLAQPHLDALEDWKYIALQSTLSKCNVVIEIEGKAKEKVVASEGSTQVLIRQLKAYYTQGKNAKLRQVLAGEQTGLAIGDAFINLAIVQKEKPSEKRDEESEKSELQDHRMMNTHEQIYGHKKPLPIAQLLRPLDVRSLDEGAPIHRASIPSMVLIEGWAGIGKSVLCQYMANVWARESQQAEQRWWLSDTALVLWIPLRNLANYDPENCRLGEVVRRECLGINDRQNLNYPSAAQIDADLAALGENVVLLLDGFDEVADWYNEKPKGKHQEQTARSELLQHVLIGNRYNHRIIVTSRPNRVTPIREKFDRRLETIGFTDKNIENYVRRNFNAAPDRGEKLLTAMKINVNLWGIAHIPVNLALICLVWQDSVDQESLPETMTTTQLYSGVVLWLLRRDWVKHPVEDNGKGQNFQHLSQAQLRLDAQDITMEEFECTLDQYPKRLSCLREMAWVAQTKGNGNILIPGSTVCDVLVKYFPEAGSNSQKQALLNEVKTLGLLESQHSNDNVRVDNNHFYFPHLTFQEYFAARHWVSLCCQEATREKAKKYLIKNKYNSNHEIVWWFVAGLLRKNTDALSFFFECLNTEPKDIMGLYHDTLLVRCHDESGLQDKQSEAFLTKLGQEIRALRNVKANDEYRYQRAQVLFHYLGLSSRLFRHECCTEAIIGLFSDNEDTVRYCAVSLLKGEKVLPEILLRQLIRYCADEDWIVRIAAVEILGSQGSLPVWVLSTLVERCADENPAVRRAAVEVFGKQGSLPEPVLTTLVERCADENNTVRRAALWALGNQDRLPKPILSTLVVRCVDKDPNVRRAAVEALESQGSLPQPILATLVERCAAKDPGVRSAAVSALGSQGSLPERILSTLVERCADKDSGVRSAAVEALGKLGSLPEWVILRLVEHCADEDPSTRSAAVEALGSQVSLPARVLSTLVERCADEDWRVREYAVRALGSQVSLPARVLSTLVERCADEDWSVRHVALKALGNQNRPPDPILSTLVKGCVDENKFVRMAAVEALGKQGSLPEWVLSRLVERCADEDINPRWSAVRVLSTQQLPSNTLLSAMNNLLRFGDGQYKVADLLKNISVPQLIQFTLLQRQNKKIYLSLMETILFRGVKLRIPIYCDAERDHLMMVGQEAIKMSDIHARESFVQDLLKMKKTLMGDEVLELESGDTEAGNHAVSEVAFFRSAESPKRTGASEEDSDECGPNDAFGCVMF